MGMYDEVHDIRYLHDEKAPRDHEPVKLPDFSKLLRYKRLGSFLGILVVMLGAGILVFNISKSQDPRSRASEGTLEEEVLVRGTVTCVKKEGSECDMTIVTDEGETIEVEKPTEENEKTTLKEGDYVVVKGKLTTASLLPNAAAKKITIQNLQSLGSAKTPTPTIQPAQSSNGAPTPTVDDTPLVTPTPTPQELKNNDPEPGVSYVTATYVVDNKATLNGQTVNVHSFLVGGYIGIPGCDFESGCNESHFVLNDNNVPGRDTNYDVTVIGGTTDQEGDYAPGQEFYTTGRVYLIDQVVYLDKIN